jgi:hypothetical protein
VKLEIDIVSLPSEAPAWAHHLQKDQHMMIQLLVEVLRRLGRIEVKEDKMKQSTQDLIDAVTGLQGTVTEVGTAIDALVAAQDAGDDDAVEAQVAVLKGLGPTLKSHLPVVAEAGTGVAQAPADDGAVVAAPEA